MKAAVFDIDGTLIDSIDFWRNLGKNYLISQGNGSVFTNLKTDIVKMMQLAIPEDSIILSFDIVIKSIFEKIKKNQQEITHLTNLRNTLLPKLMSGETDVNEVEI